MKPTPPKGQCRIAIADDHVVLRYGLRTLLSRFPEFTVVGEAGDGEELIALVEKVPCDLVLLDLSMPGMDGLKVLEILRKKHVAIRVVIFSMHKEREFFRQAVAQGVAGYILKDDDFERIPIALRDVVAGRKYFSSEMTSLLADEYNVLRDGMSLELLTRREREVLRYIAAGLTSRDIAEQLEISFRTVQTHRSNLMLKLGIHNTAELVRYALDRGLA